jgi:hypothetical protein
MRDYLFATPSLWEGIARNIDFFGTLQEYSFSENPIESDLQSLQNDVECLLKDMDTVIPENLGRDE